MKMLMEISLPKMGELLVMMRTIISPSGREVPLAELLRRREKVLLPKFRFDYMGPFPSSNGYTHILVVVDYVTKW